jgi:hypothetical protein
MRRKTFSYNIVTALLAAAAQAAWLMGAPVMAQAPTQTRSLPSFEADASWPKPLPQWTLGRFEFRGRCESRLQGHVAARGPMSEA